VPDTAEPRLSPFLAFQHIMDDEGRPLGELHAPDDAQQGVVFDMQRCPYEGVRNGAPMNASALDQAHQHGSSALALLSAWRDAIPESTSPDLGPLSLRIWWLSVCALSTPGWRAAAQTGPPTGGEATLHKSLTGLASLAWAGLTIDAHVGRHTHRTPEQWLALGEQTEMLMNAASGRACSGSPGHIMATIRVAQDGRVAQPGEPNVAGPDISAQRFARATAAVEIGRATQALAAAATGQDHVADDWTDHLCTGLPMDHAGRMLVTLLDTPLSLRPARMVMQGIRREAADPLSKLWAELDHEATFA
jgi:hypothetical protein